jgi:DNA-binding NarL/FixJ family response regulator
MNEAYNQPKGQVRVLIVDDHPLVRESLARMIQREPDLTVCGEAEDRPQAMEVVARVQPHLALVDLTLKDSSGLDLVKEISSRYPQVKILVLSMHDETVLAERVIRAGACGYITKRELPAKILQAIGRILRGEIYWSERAAISVASRIAVRSRSENSLPASLLTDREMQVFELIGMGRSTRQIAAALQIGASTVQTYRNRIKRKLHLKDGAELLQYAIGSSGGERFATAPSV